MRAADGGAGVLQLYGNYGGDRMNFDMAAEMLQLEGMEVASVRVTDDVASAPAAHCDKRRGVAGLVLVYKARPCSPSAGSRSFGRWWAAMPPRGNGRRFAQRDESGAHVGKIVLRMPI